MDIPSPWKKIVRTSWVNVLNISRAAFFSVERKRSSPIIPFPFTPLFSSSPSSSSLEQVQNESAIGLQNYCFVSGLSQHYKLKQSRR